MNGEIQMSERRQADWQRVWAGGLACALLFIATAAQAAPSAADWLASMEQALRTRHYSGVFVHELRGQSERLQIVHRAGATSEERILSLDGTGREFIRRGGELTCYLPDQRLVVVEPAHDNGVLLAGLPRLDVASSGQYILRELPPTIVRGREVRVLEVEPRDQFRYGYRLWLDARSAMPLKTQLRTSAGTVLEQTVFTELRLLKQVADSDLAPRTAASGFLWARNVEAGATPQGDEDRESDFWRLTELPLGFRMTLRARQVMPGRAAPVTQWVFSDGMATVSVFVERGADALPSEVRPGHEGARTPATAGVTQLGSSSAYSTTVRGYRVTAIGEVPPDTVRAIAGSLAVPARTAPAAVPGAGRSSAAGLLPRVGGARR